MDVSIYLPSWIRPAALAALVGTMAAVACRPAPRPSTSPTPAAPGGEAAAWTFRYAPGAVSYNIRDETSISLTSDSAGKPQMISASATISYQLADSGTRTRFTGTVDSLIVSGVAGAPEQHLIKSPIAFRGFIDPSRRRVELVDVGAVQDCASMTLSFLAQARDVLPPIGGTLARGATWQDTTTATVCRGEIPVTTTAVRTYTVQGAEGGVVHVQRASTVTIGGQATIRGAAVSITGTGQGSATLDLDTAQGRYTGAVGESTTTLTISAGQPRTFVQRVRERVTLRPSTS